jgi:azurin
MTNTTLLQLIGAGALLLSSTLAHADPCKVSIEADDNMQFNVRQIAVPNTCDVIEVTLRHSGKLSAKVMGHDWVLAKDSDVSAIVNGGLSAGFSRGFLPQNDKRIIAATKVVGGGESDTISFNTGSLAPGSRYVFFCTSPGHSTVMRGAFLLEGGTQIAKTR